MQGSRLVELMQGPLGKAIARPWFDRLAAAGLKRSFLPRLRQWAAANAAGEDVAAFIEQVGAGPLVFGKSEVHRILADVASARRRRSVAEARWEDCFFGRGAAAPGLMATIETERLDAAHEHNLLFRRFGRLRYRNRVPAAVRAIPAPAEADAVLESLGGLDEQRLYGLPGETPILASPPLEDASGTQFWISFRSPSRELGDYVTAWVYEPRGIVNPPTLIFGHGLGMDFDHWKGLKAGALPYVRAGIRIIWPEAPWHGRRTPLGRYPGEEFAARLPLSAFLGLIAATREWAVLLRWAKATSTGPVAVGGISLGALTAQMVATKARYWPQPLWPDAMLLITHCGSLWHVYEGAMVDIWGARELAAEAGWDFEAMAPFLSVTDPWERPAVPPEAIVALNGYDDQIAPYASAAYLLDRWQVPDANRFLWRRGHFSVPLGMLREPEPVDYFIRLLNGIAAQRRPPH
ncbi:alpha/beta hydrolase [Rhodoligotrophos defluvii]|uniref:alpha/beta hydrolase n=1 Tax=Rhodoligotrophos defluvii TaxID=2561934 RepID=UPI0010C983CA|nr:alpha/beta hydrolase family protein [Rhodoligotrophos defluvii]